VYWRDDGRRLCNVRVIRCRWRLTGNGGGCDDNNIYSPRRSWLKDGGKGIDEAADDRQKRESARACEGRPPTADSARAGQPLPSANAADSVRQRRWRHIFRDNLLLRRANFKSIPTRTVGRWSERCRAGAIPPCRAPVWGAVWVQQTAVEISCRFEHYAYDVQWQQQHIIIIDKQWIVYTTSSFPFTSLVYRGVFLRSDW